VIVPCGIADAGVTTLSTELGRDVPVHEVLPYAEKHLSDIFAPPRGTGRAGRRPRDDGRGPGAANGVRLPLAHARGRNPG
jgi:hypothetical protein